MTEETTNDQTQGQPAQQQQQRPVINIASPIAFQLIVENCDTAAAYYSQLFGARVATSQIIPGAANRAESNWSADTASTTTDPLSTKTIVIGNTAINLISRKYISDRLGMSIKKVGTDKNQLPIVITVKVDNIQFFIDRAREHQANILQDITSTESGHEVAFIRGEEGYVWCLTTSDAINVAAGVSAEATVTA